MPRRLLSPQRHARQRLPRQPATVFHRRGKSFAMYRGGQSLPHCPDPAPQSDRRLQWTEAGGDDDDRLAPDHLGNGGVHFLLILRVQKSGGLIQYHDGSVLQDRPGQCNPLPLSAGKPLASVTGHSIDPFVQSFQELSALGSFRRRQHLLVGGTGSSQPDVLQQAGVEQELLLRDEGDLLIQRGEGHLPQVLPPQRDASVRHIVKVDQQLGKGRFPTAGFSHQSSEAPLWDREGDAVEDFVLFIRKPHILKADLQIVSAKIRFSFFQGRNIEQRFI